MAFFYKLNAKDIPQTLTDVAYYTGYKNKAQPEPLVQQKMQDACNKMQLVLVPQAVYEQYDLQISGTELSFADVKLNSKDLARNLHNCSKVVLFAATIGAPVDALIRKSQLSGSADAAIMQGTGAMFIENFVDLLNQKIRQESLSAGFTARPRFSPGYGDVPLSFQKEFFRLLPCNKIGLTLMNTLIMAPEKSVTAFIGLTKN